MIIELDPDAGQHVGVVLRMRVGDELIIFPGNGSEFRAVINSLYKRQVHVSLLEKKEISRESPKKIHLFQAVAKGDKMDWVVQKAVELGVTSITPLATKHCAFKLTDERVDRKRHLWQQIVISACEQCGRNVVPTVYPLISIPDYLKQKSPHLAVVLSPKAKNTWRNILPDTEDISILIGPEGGFNQEEIALFIANQVMPLRLGTRILRTETAAIAMLSVLQAVLGDI